MKIMVHLLIFYEDYGTSFDGPVDISKVNELQWWSDGKTSAVLVWVYIIRFHFSKLGK